MAIKNLESDHIKPLELTKKIIESSPVEFQLVRLRPDDNDEMDCDELFFEYSAQDEKESNSYGHYLGVSFWGGEWHISHDDANNIGGNPTRKSWSDSDLNKALLMTIKYISE